jgi:hypothetical protein
MESMLLGVGDGERGGGGMEKEQLAPDRRLMTLSKSSSDAK